jgi:hypothetical protein
MEAARRWKGKTYRSAPGRSISLSEGTLDRLWYRWQKAGRDPRAIELGYKAARMEVTAGITEGICQRAGQQDIESFSKLLRLVCNGSATRVPSRRTVERAIPEPKRRAIVALMRSRRSAASAVRKIGRELKKAQAKARKVLEAPK